MAPFVYALCLATSLICTILLMRAYLRTGARLLLWSALCFAGLSLNNLGLIVDPLFPGTDLTMLRKIPSVLGIGLLVFGLVWEEG